LPGLRLTGLLQTRYHASSRMSACLPDRALPMRRVGKRLSARPTRSRGPFARVDVQAWLLLLRPAANFTTSKPYGLVNGRLGWQAQRWSASVWGVIAGQKYPVLWIYFSDTRRTFSRIRGQRLYTSWAIPCLGVNASPLFILKRHSRAPMDIAELSSACIRSMRNTSHPSRTH